MNRRDFIFLSSLIGATSLIGASPLFGKSFSLDMINTTRAQAEQDKQMAIDYYKTIYLPQFIYREKKAQQALRKIAQPFFNLHQDIDWEIYLSNEGQVNAFTIGYGFIVIDINLIKHCCDSETDLVAAIAHESGHVLNKHVETGKRLQVLYGQLNLSKFDPEIQKQFHCSFNRLQEHEADSYIIKSFLKTGYDIHQASNIMKNLAKRHTGKQSIEQCLYSDHPDMENRIQKLDGIASTFTQPTSKTYNPKAFEYLKNKSDSA